MPITRSSSFARSFIPMTTKLWNKLPTCLRQETRLKVFKKGMHTTDITGPNPDMGMTQSRIISRLRIKCFLLES